MKFDDYELIHKTDLLILKGRLNELERKNKDLMDLVDVKRMWIVDKTEKRLADILRVGHRLADRKDCTCDHHPMMPYFTCPRCQELKAEWKAVAGDPKE